MALKAALLASVLSDQKPMSRYEKRPMSSQPIKRTTRLADMARRAIKLTNALRSPMNLYMCESVAM
jgi:hypothetical protein